MDWILGKKMKSVTKYIIFLIRYIKIIIMIILYITSNLQVTNVVRDTLFNIQSSVLFCTCFHLW